MTKPHFLSSVSHELRNQIAPIYSLSEMIKDQFFGKIDDAKNKQEYLSAAQDIYNVAHDMLDLVNDLMDYDQAASGDFSIHLEKVDIVPLIKSAIRINLDLATKNKIKIDFDQNIKLPTINLDPRRTKQILINLISNAIKYSKENTTIIVSTTIKQDTTAKPSKPSSFTMADHHSGHCECCSDKLFISIKDQGIGMNQQEVEMALNGEGAKIDKSALQTPIDSHGIGMPLVKRLVELQNGKMEIKSGKNQGTEVILEFSY